MQKKICFLAAFCLTCIIRLQAQPVISSLSSSQGIPGSSVTITGSSFNTTTTNNVVFFGATQATVTAATATSLTATVPTGATYNNLSVLNTSTGLAGFSQYPFLPEYNNATYITGLLNFDAKVNFGASTAPVSVAIGDIDGDGKPDVAIVSSSAIYVYRNTSASGSITAGSFAAPLTFSSGGSSSNNMVIGDINGDGKPDLVVTNFGSNTVSVLRNTSSSGSISFATAVTFATGSGPENVAISDLDKDGKPDLVVCCNSNAVDAFRNTSSGTTISFATAVILGSVTQAIDVKIGDIDGDGKPDVAVISYSNSTVSVFRNTSAVGTISVAAAVTVATGSNPKISAIGDVDGDGKLDLVVANFGANNFSVIRNTSTVGTISFATKVDFAAGSSPYCVVIGDIDGDGKPDLAVVNSGNNTVSLYRNTATSGTISAGSLAAAVTLTAGTSPQIVAMGDIDGDGKPDIVTANAGGGNISVIRNDPFLQPPVITSASQYLGNPGTAVTITGNYFNAVPANNIVYFGATQAVVSAGSVTSLNVTVPAGATYSDITVENTAYGLTGFTQYPFLPVYNSSIYAAGAVNLDPKVDFTAGTQPDGVAIGDIDGDGKPDVVVTNRGSGTVSVYRNTSASGSITAGSFAAKVDFTTGSSPGYVAIGDIDGDGKPDIAVANYGSSTVSVLRNTSVSGSVSFATQVTAATGGQPNGIAIGDIDGDGKPDLAVANWNGGTVSVLRNTSVSGSVSFATQVTAAVGSGASGIVIGDIDGDGKPDLAVANLTSNTVSVLRNTSTMGSVSFATQVTAPTGTQPNCIAIGDIDGDGKPDLAVANYSSNTVSILRNSSVSGFVSFAIQVSVATGNGPASISIGDIDGDGKPDLAVANENISNVSVLRNTSTTGSVSFATQVIASIGGAALSIAMGDLDGDGKPDIVTANNNVTTISVIRNDPFLLAPVISSVSTYQGTAGASVSITGNHFNATPANNIVYFGATQAVVSAASVTSLNVTVPAGATYSDITIENTGDALAGASPNPFLPEYSNSGYIAGTVNLDPKVDLAAGTHPGGVAVGDVDGDGKPDIVVVNMGSNTVSVYRNISASGSITAGSFATQVNFSTGGSPVYVALADIDRDGKPDIVVTNRGSNTVSVFRNTSTIGSVSFAAQVTATTGNNPEGIAIGDIDGDGRYDLVVANYGSNTVSVLRNTSAIGSVSFAGQVTVATGAQPYGAVIGDIDGDGKPDVAVTNFGSATVSVLRNTSTWGAISFATQITAATGTNPDGIAISDIDGDGKLDLAVANYNSNTVSVLRNTSVSGTVSLATRVDFTSGSQPGNIAIGDMDGDGKPDLAVTDHASNKVSVYRNTATSGIITTSSFAAKTDFATGTGAAGIAIADIDGDGQPDIVAADSIAATISVLRNDPLQPIAGSTTICAASAVTLSDAVPHGTWSSGNTAIATVGSGTGIVTAIGYGTVVITYAGTAGAAFLNNVVTTTVNVIGQVFTGTSPESLSVCINSSANSINSLLEIIDLSTGQTETWTVGSAPLNGSVNTGGTQTSDANILTPSGFSYTPNAGYSGNDVFTINVNNGTCTNTTTINVTVGASPVVDPITGPSVVCAASTIALTDASGSGAWFSSNLSIATIDGTGTVTGVSAGSVVIGYVLFNGCGTGENFAFVTVNPLPDAGSITGAATGCVGVATSLSDDVSGGTWSNDNTAVATIDGTGTITGVATGTTTVSYTVTNGCGSTNATAIVTIDQIPDAGSITGVATGCVGAETALSDTTGGGIWSNDNTAIATIDGTGTIMGVAAGTTTVSYIVTNSCGSANATAVVTVNALPDAGSIMGVATVCTGATTALTDGTGGGAWSNDNTAVATIDSTGTITGIATGITTVSYTVTNGCGSVNTTNVVTVNPLPDAGSITGASTVCVGATTSLSDDTGGGAWSDDDAAVATIDSTGTATGVAVGTTTVSYTITNSCGSANATAVVTVNPLPDAGSITGIATVCVDATTVLTDGASGGAWSNDNTLVATIDGTGTITGVAIGTTTVSYTITNSCGSANATSVVTVNPLPIAGSITGAATVCTGATTVLTDGAGGGVWSNDNTLVATIDGTGTVTGVAAGTTTVSYTITNSCGSANATSVVTVNPLPDAGSITGVATVCAGAATALTDGTGGGVWSNDNTSVATIDGTGTITGVGAGTTTVSYIVTNSCGSANATAVVTVNPLAVAGSISGAATVCTGAAISLSDGAAGGVWSNDNTSVATIDGTGTVSGVAAGTTTVSYIVTNSCGSANATTVVTVNPLAVAGSITGAASICPTATTALSNTVSGGTWTSGSTSIATIGSSTGIVTGVASGTTTITYSVSNTCGIAAATTVVTVNSAASAGTINGSSVVNTGSNITLTDVASGGVWSTSNSDATISGGLVTGITAGTVIISYSVTNSCGTAIATKTITVNSSSISGITGIASLCAGATTSLSDAATGGTWSSSNSLVASIGTTGIVTGVAAGTANITYTQGGTYTTIVVTVNPTPLPVQGMATECVGITISLSDGTPGGTWSSSNSNVLVSGSTVTGVIAGSSTISYILPSGCYTTYPNTVHANPAPITGPGTVCPGSIIILSDTTSGAMSYTSSNTLVATIDNSGTVTGVTAGTVTITYKIMAGCITTTAVTVNALPAAISGNSQVCAGSAVTLSDLTGPGAWSSSNAAIATIGSGSGIVTGVAGGMATITYIAGSTGCKATTIVTVSPILPVSGNTNVCIGTTTTLSDASTGGTWLSGNTGIATVGSTGLVTGVSIGSVAITYTLASGCTMTATVNVGAMTPVLGTTNLCASMTTTLSDATGGGTWSISSALIASIGTSGIVTTSNTYTGTATISYSAGGCVATRVLTVNARPTPIQGATSECAGINVTLSDLTSGGTWSCAGGATIGTSGILTAGSSAGTATITYTLGTGCYVTYPNTIHPNPTAILGTFNVCAGSYVILSDATSGALSWTSSNTLVATADNSGTVTGVAIGTTTITYKILTGNCITTQTVTVNAVPVVTAIQGPASISHAAPATLSDATTGGIWSSSHTTVIALSGSTGSSVTATAVATSGTSVISYAVTNGIGCTTTVTKTITAATAPPPHDGSTEIEPIPNPANEKVLLYPNPSYGAINIRAEVAGVFYLYSLDGRSLNEYKITDGITSLTLPSELAAGMYIGRYIGDDGNTALFRIVKQ